MKTLSVISAVVVCTNILLNNCLCAQWKIIPSPWGEGIFDQIVSNDSDIFVTDGLSVYMSSDNGNNWSDIGSSLGSNYVGPIYVVGSAVFAVAGDSGFVFRTTDNGENWDSASVGLMPHSIGDGGTFSGDIKNLFLCPGYGFPENGKNVFRTTDSGVTWTKGGEGLPVDAYLSTLAVCSTNVFAASRSTFNGVFRSTDSGVTWSVVTGLPVNSPVFSIISIGRVIVIGLETKGQNHGDIFRSSNNGETWTKSIDGLPLPDTAFQFVIKDSLIFASLDAYGVFISSDSGQTWNKFLGPPDGDPLCRSIAVTDQSVFVGTLMNGLWRRPLSDFKASVVLGESLVPIVLSPNPTSGFVTVYYPSSKMLDISISNVLGKRVLDLPNPREQNITLDLTRQPAGTYFVRITTPEGIEVRKIIKSDNGATEAKF